MKWFGTVSDQLQRQAYSIARDKPESIIDFGQNRTTAAYAFALGSIMQASRQAGVDFRAFGKLACTNLAGSNEMQLLDMLEASHP